MPVEYSYKFINSPVGILKLIASSERLVGVLWQREERQVYEFPDAENQSHPILLQTEMELIEYFEKKRMVFSIPLDFVGTEFQVKVWKTLLTIPFGETRTYGDIAKHVGSAGSVRAVGGAVNKNPISIIAPCHRVIGATGKLVGFGGGIENKIKLLRLEERNPTLF